MGLAPLQDWILCLLGVEGKMGLALTSPAKNSAKDTTRPSCRPSAKTAYTYGRMRLTKASTNIALAALT